MSLNAIEHRERVSRGCRRQAECHVLQNFNKNAAEAECDELAERTVGDGADDDFGAALQHLLDLDAFDLCICLVLLGIGQNGVVGLFCVRGCFHADDHAARFSLMENVGRNDLHHDRETHAACDLGSIRSGLCNAFLRNRDSVSIANQFALGSGQAGAFVCFDGVENLSNLGLRLLSDVNLPRCVLRMSHYFLLSRPFFGNWIAYGVSDGCSPGA